ncbi:MAG TPA: hypothetical protein VIK86_04370 [Candidatus Paceibacterota bacterium]
MNYFGDCMENLVSIEIIEDSNRPLFRDFNSQKRENPKCSANKICWNNENEVMAIKCNCNKKTYHPIFDGKVDWNYIISANNISGLKKLSIEKLRWIIED